MATHTLPADVRPAKITGASGMINTPTCRRALIGGVALAAMSLSAPALAAKASPQTYSRTRWDAVVAELRARQADYSAASMRHNDAEEAYYEARPARPMFTIEAEGDYGRFGKHILPVTLTHDELDDLARTWNDPEQITGFRARLAEYQAADEAAKFRHGVRAAADVARTAGDAEIVARERVMAFPATDARMLAEKLEILAPEYSEDASVWAALVADAKHVARKGERA